MSYAAADEPRVYGFRSTLLSRRCVQKSSAKHADMLAAGSEVSATVLRCYVPTAALSPRQVQQLLSEAQRKWRRWRRKLG